MSLRTFCVLMVSMGALYGQVADDEKKLRDLIATFQGLARSDEPNARAKLLANDYVHVTPDGAMTTSWRVIPDQALATKTDQLSLRVFGDVAVASYRLHSDSLPARMASVTQVFQKRGNAWRIIATQTGGPGEPLSGPIAAVTIVPPVSPAVAARELRETWTRQLLAADLKTPSGEHAEDLDTIRSIFAEDAMYVNPDGTVLTREQVLARGHPNTVQLSGKQVASAVAENKFFHIDERFAIFGDVAVWTSRNPGNLDQSLRVYLKRAAGWQMIFVHHGMSVR